MAPKKKTRSAAVADAAADASALAEVVSRIRSGQFVQPHVPLPQEAVAASEAPEELCDEDKETQDKLKLLMEVALHEVKPARAQKSKGNKATKDMSASDKKKDPPSPKKNPPAAAVATAAAGVPPAPAAAVAAAAAVTASSPNGAALPPPATTLAAATIAAAATFVDKDGSQQPRFSLKQGASSVAPGLTIGQLMGYPTANRTMLTGSDEIVAEEKMIDLLMPCVGYRGPGETSIPLPLDYKPDPNCVICGKGKEAFDHAGNQRFRQIIQVFLPHYRSQSKLTKTLIIGTIVGLINVHCQLPGNAFIRWEGVRWECLSDAACREKVGQSLRAAHVELNPRQKAQRKAKRAMNRAKRRLAQLNKEREELEGIFPGKIPPPVQQQGNP